MSRPRLLDLFCGAGGAAMGYHRAGFDVVGMDANPQPHYPFPWWQRDALVFLRHEYAGGFDAIHASPPCQFYANVTDWRGSQDDHPDLLPQTLALLDLTGVPWVVENVPEAVTLLRPDYRLCGSQFGLNVRRHRIFQTSWHGAQFTSPCNHHRGVLPFMHKGERAYADAMGCTWMTKEEARQAIPPAYTEHIGRQLLDHLAAAAA